MGQVGPVASREGGLVVADERVDGCLGAWGRGATRRGALGVLVGLAGVGRREVAAKRRRLPKKVTICHFTARGPTPYVLKRIAGKDLARHQQHGDFVYGTCCLDSECQAGQVCAAATDAVGSACLCDAARCGALGGCCGDEQTCSAVCPLT